ncbi:hypothetical protein JHK86_004651 [Glycine max]|nr:hypothetical protein JHK86_004651 [Glycine max]
MKAKTRFPRPNGGNLVRGIFNVRAPHQQSSRREVHKVHELLVFGPRSANIGVSVCLKCCGVHRSIGSQISKVLFVTLDEWSSDEIDAMIEVGGNSSANYIYEAYFPKGYTKPGPDASHKQ